VATKGFIVRNAANAGSTLDLAEPDALDFNLLSRNRYGVIEGCDPISITGWVVTVPQGVVSINDTPIALTTTQVTLPTSSQDLRFDLIAVDLAGHVVYLRGEPSPNPIYPEYGDDVTVVAAVLVRPGVIGPAASDITDKRVFLSRRFLSTATTGDLLASYAATPSLVAQFRLSAQGYHEWVTDTRMFRSAPATLRIEDNLDVAEKLTADMVDATTVTVAGDITAANLMHGLGPPGALVGTPGDLYQDQQNGGLWSWENDGGGFGWDRLSTTPIPAGMIMASLSSVEPAGWLLMNGRTVSKVQSGGLWDAFPAWRVDASTLRLPQGNGMFLRQGPLGSDGGKATAKIEIANLPPHKHLDSPTTEAGGDHTHLASTEDAGGHQHYTQDGQGIHNHEVNDPQHFHEGVDGGAGGGFIGAMWGGTRRLDGPFNDASHPVSVEIVANTKPSPSHVTVRQGQGAHQHFTNAEPPHTHPVTIQPYNAKHTHNVTERSVGGGQDIPILPPYMAVNYLIKT
jgi:hypothetical protein